MMIIDPAYITGWHAAMSNIPFNYNESEEWRRGHKAFKDAPIEDKIPFKWTITDEMMENLIGKQE